MDRDNWRHGYGQKYDSRSYTYRRHGRDSGRWQQRDQTSWDDECRQHQQWEQQRSDVQPRAEQQGQRHWNAYGPEQRQWGRAAQRTPDHDELAWRRKGKDEPGASSSGSYVVGRYLRTDQSEDFYENGWPTRSRSQARPWPRQTGGGWTEPAPSALGRAAATSSNGTTSERRNPDGSAFVPPPPRRAYVEFAAQKPRLLPPTPPEPSMQPWPPRKLLILDLNGTLCYRKRNKASSGSLSPTPRPYLRNFFQYCLGHGASAVHDDVPASTQPTRHRPGLIAELSNLPPLGTQFWTDEMLEDHDQGRPRRVDPQARYELLIWSSAQDHNVDLMMQSLMGTKFDLRAGELDWRSGEPRHASGQEDREGTEELKSRSVSPLSARSESPMNEGGPNEDEPLTSIVISRTALPHPASFLRVWGRTTLVIARHRNLKVPSVKDLEIVWTPLNTGDETLLRADDRRDNFGRDDEEGTSSIQDHLTLDPFLWGPHNTFLLDDSTDKTSMQPYNHLWVPEFDPERAKAAEKFTRAVRGIIADDTEEPVEEEVEAPLIISLDGHLRHSLAELDDVLLQTIGVLEMARQQENVAAWVRSGALGRYGPPPLGGDDADAHICGGQNAVWEPEDWAREGRKALKELGIEPSPI